MIAGRGEKMKLGYNIYSTCIFGIFICCLFFYGMYYEFCGSIIGLILSVVLGMHLLCKGKLSLHWNLGIAVAGMFVIFHFISVVYAVDAGMSALGIFKYAWIFLFLLCYMQLKPKEKEYVIGSIPYVGLVIFVLGVVAFFVEGLYRQWYVNDRLGGCFQYPNTCALFLLVGFILLGDKKNLKKWEYGCLLCLLVGILMTGSRTVFVLTFCVAIFLVFRRKNVALFFVVLGIAIAGIIYFLVTEDVSNIGRIATFSLTDSTLIGRILYAKDAVGLLLEHPFGMGHMGYYYMQNLIQTGMYSVQYVHNDWLQIGLDIGWFPMVFYAVAVVKAMFCKAVSGTQKLILAVIFLHGLLDFDLSYGSFLCVMLLIMVEVPISSVQREQSSIMTWNSLKRRVTIGILAMWSIVCVYFSVPLLAYYNGDAKMAVQWYPWYTEAKLVLLSESEDVDEVEKLADEILKQNDTCALAYAAKAMVAYCEDDYTDVICYQKKAIDRNYYSYEEYNNYAYMLYDGVIFSEKEQTIQMCKAELYNIPQYLEDAKSRLSKLGAMIDDQPQLEVDEELTMILEEIRE